MGFLNTDSMPRLVEKLADGDNIKITGNSKGNRVGTVVKKIVEKADDVTKAIEQEVVNDSYSFKVGTGDVDVSSDVEDGFSEVGLKGVTYQNLLLTPKDEFPISILKDLSHSLPILPPTKDITLIAKFSNIVEGARYRFLIGNKYYDGNFSPIVRLKWNYSDVANATNIRFGCHQSSNQAILTELIILEGDHVDNPNIPNHFEGIVGVGDESKNLFNPQKIADDLGLDVVSEGLVINKLIGNRLYIDSITPKPNTVYHISIQEYLPITTNETWSPIIGLEYTDGTNYESYTYTGLTTLTSSAKSVHRFYIRNPFANVSGCWKNVHIVESKIATQYKPYYDGYKIDILSKTRSVSNEDFLNHVASFGISNIKCEKYLGKLRFTAMGGHYENNFNDKRTLRLIPNTKYTLKMIIDVDTPSTYIIAGALNKTKITNTHYEFTTDSTGMVAIYPFSTGTNFVNVPFDIVIEPSDNFPNDLNYKEYKSQILLNEPLMRLPNGVCDEITRDGKLIRRVGKVVLDGNELERYTMEDNKATTIFFNHRNIEEITSKGLLCNTFVAYSESIYNEDKEGVYCVSGIKFRIAKSKLSTLNADGFKQWLKANPTTVYYELSTPIITELPAPCLRIFKDGYLTFNTLVAPESTHVVQLNKSAQIERSIREVQSLDSRVGKLESFYDDMMLETSHKLSLLNYDFEYTRERNGE